MNQVLVKKLETIFIQTHNFWNSNGYDGTRAFISGSDLSGFTGVWSVENHVICQDFGTFGRIIDDMTCLAQ